MEISKDSNIYLHQGFITRDKRNQELGHQSGVVWLTGLSGPGKSTIAYYFIRVAGVADLIINTSNNTIAECTTQLVSFIKSKPEL